MNLAPVTTALVAFEGRPSNVVCNIMKNIVTKNSSNKYDAENVKRLLWLYNDEKLREEILRDSLVDSLNEASHQNAT